MLAEEEHESGAVLIHRPTMPFHQRHAFDNVRELDLLVTRELRNPQLGQSSVDGHCSLLGEDVFILIVGDGAIEVGSRTFLDGLGL